MNQNPRRAAFLVAGLAAVGLACSGAIDVDEQMPDDKAPVPGGSTGGPSPGAGGGAGPGTGTPTGGAGAGGGSTSPGVVATTGPIVSTPFPSPRLFRLSHRQYENSVRDLLRLSSSPGLATSFISEPTRSNFDNSGALLQVSPGLWLDYQRAAESMAETVVKDPRRMTALGADPAKGAREFIRAFGLRAYRRPLADAELAQYETLFNQGPKLVGSGNAWNDGVQLVLTLILQSPHFLYRTELSAGPPVDGKIKLDDHEIASKLSYAIVGSMPDDPLFMAAAARQLQTREGVLQHARRLLATSAAQRTIEDFHAQLLNMMKYDFISKDPRRFPDYPSGMAGLVKAETLAFIKDVLITREKGFTELMTAPYTMLTTRTAPLAPVYGVSMPAVTAADTRVDLDPTRRAGLLTQLGFLAAYADGAQPQTILRGAFVLHEILCRELPPPPDAFNLPPVTGKTNRQRIEAATHVAACAGCHQTLINPPGFALEHYDAIGKYRTTDNGLPVDAKVTFAVDDVERTFEGGVALAKLLAESRQAHDCYSSHWLEYMYSRPIEKEKEKDLIAQLGARSLMGGASLKSLLLDMVSTDAFLTRAP